MIFLSTMDALHLWPDDPAAACGLLFDAVQSPDIAPASILDGASLAARMALRTGDEPRLTSSVAAFVGVAARTSGPIRALQRRWMEALAAPADSAEAARDVAREFEAIGYPLPAADCFADAAVLAERAGQDPGADRAEAARLYAACGAVSLLG